MLSLWRESLGRVPIVAKTLGSDSWGQTEFQFKLELGLTPRTLDLGERVILIS